MNKLEGKIKRGKPRRVSTNWLDMSFKESGNLGVHVKIHTDQREFKCSHDGCEKKFITKGHLQTHELIHTGERPFKCDLCGKTCKNNEHLKDHLQTTCNREQPTVTNPNNACHSCEKTFSSAADLGHHVDHDHVQGLIVTPSLQQAL